MSKDRFIESRDRFVPDLHVWVENAIKASVDGLHRVKTDDERSLVLAHISNEGRRLASFAVCSAMGQLIAVGATREKVVQKADELINLLRRQMHEDLDGLLAVAMPKIEAILKEHAAKVGDTNPK